MKRFHVKKGDEVVVISGAAKGRRGRVRMVLSKNSRVILEALDEAKKKEDEKGKKSTASEEEKRKMVKPVLHYMRKSQQNPQGGIMWLEGSVHISNVMLATHFDARVTKRGGAKAKA